MKIGTFTRCVVPACAGVGFVAVGLVSINSVGVHPLPIALVLVGAFALAVGIYYGICRLDFRDGGFIAYPGSKRYHIDDVVSWRLGEDVEAELGHRRHLELRFDSWYRRYMLFEDDASPAVFDDVLRLLREKKPA